MKDLSDDLLIVMHEGLYSKIHAGWLLMQQITEEMALRETSTIQKIMDKIKYLEVCFEESKKEVVRRKLLIFNNSKFFGVKS